MKRMILTWLLVCLLLLGCSAPQPAETTAPPLETAAPVITESQPTEPKPREALEKYELSIPHCLGVQTMGEDVLVFSEGDTGTVLTRLSGTDLTPLAQRSLTVQLMDQIFSVQACEQGLSYYDEDLRETVLLDETLREIGRIPSPDGMVGNPILSPDQSALYYCTEDSICALELETRLPRVVRQYSGNSMMLDGVYLDGTLLKCSSLDVTYFIDAENGQLLEEQEGWFDFVSAGANYITSFWREEYNNLVFGTAGIQPQALYIPNSSNAPCLLADSFAIVDIGTGDTTVLDYYDLASGTHTASLTLEGDCYPIIADGGDGLLWVLTRDLPGEHDVLYRWDTKAEPAVSSQCLTSPYFSRSNPDLSGIEACRETARALSEKHGVEILVWEDALHALPWDFTLTEEYLVPLLEDRLDQLDQQLSNFPEGFFQTLSEDLSGLTISLVRKLEGDTSTGAIANASGLQYWIENHAYIALSTVDPAPGSLYHELSHVLDTRIFSESNAYDQWEEINPSGFRYDYDYIANAQRNAGEYLREEARCFIDTYSMSFPKEDRARVLEYAMTEGNESYFQSDIMQKKLLQVCVGIREAFGLKKSPEAYLWEQYLKEPLAYSK